MSTVIDTLVYDRTQADVDRVYTLKSKILTEGLSTLTSAENAEYMGGMKGCCNYTDLNRVGEAVNYLRDELSGMAVVADVAGKTDWTVGDTPSSAQMQTYLQNIERLRVSVSVDTETTPDTMCRLTLEKMNAIEKILHDVGTVVRNIQNGWYACAEFACGET